MYIRTKNRIYQVESTLRDNAFIKGYNVGEMAFIRKDQVINQSENLEKLCDEFVVEFIKDGYKYVWNERYNSTMEELKSNANKVCNIYGAIWTYWGLKYVAKMDSEGELVLI